MKKKDKQHWKSNKNLNLQSGLKYLDCWNLETKMGKWTISLLQTDSLTSSSDLEMQKLISWTAFLNSTLVKSEEPEAAAWPFIKYWLLS